MHRERDLNLWYRSRALDMQYIGVPGEGLYRTALHCTALHCRSVCVWGGGTIRRCAAAMRSLQLPNTSTPTVPAPGIVNFIDARTQWIDDGFKRALQDGIKQVCLVLQGSEVLTSCQSGP